MDRAVSLVQKWAIAGNTNAWLRLDHLDLTQLPVLPNNLKWFSCKYNKLTTLSNLPGSLTDLICGNNKLTVLPNLPEYLETLGCGGNSLTVLPTLPESLKTLVCDANQLTVLPTLPESLEFLDCSDNQLTVLPELPEYLEVLSCGGNKLTVLPELPNDLKELNCDYNRLINIPSSTDVLSVDCGNQNVDDVEDVDDDEESDVEDIENEESEVKELKEFKEELETKNPYPLDDINKRCTQGSLDIITGELRNVNDDIVIFILPSTSNKYITECITTSELKSMFENYNSRDEDNIPNLITYYGDKNILQSKNYPVFKLNYLGIFIQSSQFLPLRYNTFVLKEAGIKKIGSSFGVSRIHGSEEMVYRIIPVNRRLFLEDQTVAQMYTENISEFRFIPQPEDYVRRPIVPIIPSIEGNQVITQLFRNGSFMESNKDYMFYTFPALITEPVMRF